MYQADQHFVSIMRSELGNPNLGLVWKKNEPRYTDGGRGCWCVTQSVRQCVPQKYPAGRYIIKSEVIPYEVFMLNGNHDLPTRPGRWVISELARADMARHGKARKREVGDWREAKAKRGLKSRDTLAYERARDPLLFAAMAKEGEARGTATYSREDMIAAEKYAALGSEQIAAQDAADLRAARLGA